MKRYGTDYEKVKHNNLQDADFAAFFKGGIFGISTFGNRQQFDMEGLKGRLQSSSYTPPPDDERYEPMIGELHLLFEHFQQDGVVAFRYETEIFWGEV